MESGTSLIRNNLREQMKHEREERRMEAVNYNRRALGDMNVSDRVINTDEIVDLANKLKCKKTTLQDLKNLKQALIQSEDNIWSFLNVNGALHSLVREASGHKTHQQLEALNCCCNLALGNEKAGMLVTKAVAPYLMSQLDCFSPVILDICVWTLGNLAGSGEKPWSVLKSQGVLPKFLQLISMGNVTQSAVYALTQYAKTGFALLEDHELEAIAEAACQLMLTEPSVYWLIYLLSCTEKCDMCMLKYSVVSKALKLLLKATNENGNQNVMNVTALLRVMGNLCGAKRECVEELMQTADSQKEILALFETLIISSFLHIKCESLWVIGNIAQQHPKPETFLSQLEPNLTNAIKSSMALTSQ